MDGDELGAVRKSSFDLHLENHLRNAGQHLRAAQDAAAVADEFEKLRGQERHRLRIVEAQTAGEPLLREEAGAVQQELVEIMRREVHRVSKGRCPIKLEWSADGRAARAGLPRR